MKISVIMSIYKEPIDWIRLSIDSILNQTYKDFEFIIVNDKPDREENRILLEEYSQRDSRIIVITNQENIGLTKSLNKALRLSKGEYIARMDADDISEPQRFEKQLYFMERNKDVIVCGTNVRFIGRKFIANLKSNRFKDDSKNKAALFFNSCFVHPTVLIRKSVLNENSIEYDETYRHTQDYRLWECLSEYGKFANLSEKLLRYRCSDMQITHTNSSSQLKYAINIRRRLLKKYLIKNHIDFDVENYNLFYVRKKLLETTKKDDMFYGAMKILYFSSNKNKKKNFIKSILNGDFFHFSFIDKIRYISIIIGHKKVNYLF